MRIIESNFVDVDYFNYRDRRNYIIKNNIKFASFHSMRSYGKTIAVFRTEFQETYRIYKSTNQVKPIGILIRTKNEWDKIKHNFLENLKPLLNFDFQVHGQAIYLVETVIKGKRVVDKLTCKLADILFIWSANSYKKASLEHLRMLVFDEIQPEQQDYIPNEVNKLHSIISTVSRLNDTAYIIALSNNVSNECLHYSQFGLTPDLYPQPGKIFMNDKNKFMLESVKNNEFITEKLKKSFAGNLQKNTKYGDFAFGKIANDENYAIYPIKNIMLIASFNIWWDREGYCLYWDKLNRVSVIKKGENKTAKRTYYLDLISATAQKQASQFSYPGNFINLLHSALKDNSLFFDTVTTRDIFLSFIVKIA